MSGPPKGEARGMRHDRAQAMPKETAERRVQFVRRGLLAASAIAFALLLQAAVHHVTGVTSRRSTSNVNTGVNSNNAGLQGPSYSQPSGYGFGSSDGAPPVTSTGVS